MEGEEHSRRVEILDVTHEDRSKLDGFGEFGRKVEDGLGGFLMRPVQTRGDGVFDESWMRVAENGENGMVAIVSSGSLGRFRISWERR